MGSLSNKWIYFMLIYTASVWGLNVVLIKILTLYFDVIMMAAFRVITACIPLGIFVLAKWKRFPRIHLKQWLWITVGSFLLIYFHQVTLVYGLSWTTATNASLILALNPLISIALAFIFYKEELSLIRIVGVLTGLLGVAIVILSASNAQVGVIGLGDFMMLVSMLSNVVGGLYIKKISKDLDPLLIAFYMHMVSMVMLFIHSSFSPAFYNFEGWFPNFWVWGIILISGMLSTGIGNLFWGIGISQVGIGKTTLFINWLPISGLIFSAIFLGEIIKPVHLVGLVCVLAGVYLGVKKTKLRAGKKLFHGT